ncbi:low temperature requirement protein A [Streptomyces ardesiacus]
MVAQWLRVAVEHPECRSRALRYAAGITVVQICWVTRPWAPDAWAWTTFLVLVAAEPAVSVWAEYRDHPVGRHPGHVAECYSLFAVIVLGEVILGSLAAVRPAVTDRGLSAPVLLIATGGLLIVFALRRIYFTANAAGLTALRSVLTLGGMAWGSMATTWSSPRRPRSAPAWKRLWTPPNTPHTPLHPGSRTGSRRLRNDRAPDLGGPAPGHPYRSSETHPAGIRRRTRSAGSGLQRTRAGNGRRRPGMGLAVAATPAANLCTVRHRAGRR